MNIKDKRQQTPLHYVVEKQEHTLFKALLKCPNVDVFKLDSDLLRPKQQTVIFSSFYKILLRREKLHCMKLFQKALRTDYIDYAAVLAAAGRDPSSLLGP